MNIEVRRYKSLNGATVGEMWIDGDFECFTLEDQVREIPGLAVSEWKVQNQTAIPFGVFDVVIDFSIRFQREMPHVLNVPGFSGIRIHSGNTAADTDGCILLGQQREMSKVDGSRLAFASFFAKLTRAIEGGEQVKLAVKWADQQIAA